jgi:peptidoglycan/LPS O-acetylase OafA/YrhL
MFFYLLFAGALAFKANPLRVMTPLLIAFSVIGFFHNGNWPPITTVADPVLLEFLAGMGLAYAVRADFKLPMKVSVALGGLGAIGLLTIPFTAVGRGFYGARALEWGIPAVMLVGAATMLEDKLGGKIPLWLLKLGDASYSLYIFHALIILVVVRVLYRTPIRNLGEIPTVLLFLVISVLGALAIHRYLERPLTLALAKLAHLRAARSVVSAEKIRQTS